MRRGKWTITVEGGTFEGYVVGAITATDSLPSYVSGTFIGFGTGDYTKQRIKGSFEGDISEGLLVRLTMEGVLN